MPHSAGSLPPRRVTRDVIGRRPRRRSSGAPERAAIGGGGFCILGPPGNRPLARREGCSPVHPLEGRAQDTRLSVRGSRTPPPFSYLLLAMVAFLNTAQGLMLGNAGSKVAALSFLQLDMHQKLWLGVSQEEQTLKRYCLNSRRVLNLQSGMMFLSLSLGKSVECPLKLEISLYILITNFAFCSGYVCVSVSSPCPHH